jgi:delta 1-pyrroline-5-carboxylate dehydrogenase
VNCTAPSASTPAVWTCPTNSAWRLCPAPADQRTQPWRAEPIIDAELDQGVEPVINPSEPGDVVGYVREATEGEVSRALDAAAAAGPIWFATPPSERAAILERAAELDGRPTAKPVGHAGARSRQNL